MVDRPQLCRRPDIFTSETRGGSSSLTGSPKSCGAAVRRPAGIGGPSCCSDGQQGDGRLVGVEGQHPAGSNGQTGQSQTIEESRMARNARAHCNLRCVCTPRPAAAARCSCTRSFLLRPAPAAAALFRRERTSRQVRGSESAVPIALPLPRGPRHGSMTRRDATKWNQRRAEPEPGAPPGRHSQTRPPKPGIV